LPADIVGIGRQRGLAAACDHAGSQGIAVQGYAIEIGGRWNDPPGSHIAGASARATRDKATLGLPGKPLAIGFGSVCGVRLCRWQGALADRPAIYRTVIDAGRILLPINNQGRARGRTSGIRRAGRSRIAAAHHIAAGVIDGFQLIAGAAGGGTCAIMRGVAGGAAAVVAEIVPLPVGGHAEADLAADECLGLDVTGALIGAGGGGGADRTGHAIASGAGIVGRGADDRPALRPAAASLA